MCVLCAVSSECTLCCMGSVLCAVLPPPSIAWILVMQCCSVACSPVWQERRPVQMMARDKKTAGQGQEDSWPGTRRQLATWDQYVVFAHWMLCCHRSGLDVYNAWDCRCTRLLTGNSVRRKLFCDAGSMVQCSEGWVDFSIELAKLSV